MFWGKYKNYVYHIALKDSGINMGAAYFYRTKLFLYSLVYFIPLSILAVTPAIIMSVKSGNWVMCAFHMIVFGWIWIAVFVKNISLRLRKNLFIFILYTVAVGLFFFLKTSGPGMIYLLGVSIWTSLSVNNKAGLYSLISNIVISILFPVIQVLFSFNADPGSEFQLDYWIPSVVNLIIINSILTLSLNYLLSMLDDRIRRENKLKLQLKSDNMRLAIAKAKAEESDNLKSAFLTNMSHEIRTPMNAIVGFSDLLRRMDLTPEQKSRYVDIINMNTEILLRIIEDIIELSKIDSRTIKFEKAEVNLHDYFDEFIRTMEEIKPDNIELIHEVILPENKCIVRIDAVKITQILNNLMTNAYKYTENGKVHISIQYRDQSYIIKVIDSGIGIPLDKQQFVFNRFYQVNNEFNGVGLGLSIVKSLTELMGGRVSLNSTPNKGSSFTLVFPELSLLAKMEKSVI